MSDFLFSPAARRPGTLRGALAAYLGGSASVEELHGPWGSLAVAQAPHDDPPVLEPAVGERGPLLVIGRPRVRGSVMEALQEPAPDWSRVLDGPFVLVDLRAAGRIRIVTDLFGWVPLFAGAGDGGPVLGTHPDAVARAAGRDGRVDAAAVAEFLAFRQVSWPYTLYAEVRQLPPAWDLDVGLTQVAAMTPERLGGSGRRYWEPRESDAFAALPDAAAELRLALVEDVEAACAGLDRAGVLLSGGEDARVVLGAVPEPVAVEGITVAPFANREVRSARRVARAYGASFRYIRRPGTHDLEHLEAVAALVGSQHQWTDAHTYPFHESHGLAELPVVLGGFSSDALLKGDNVTRAARRHGPGFRRPMAAPSLPGLRADAAEEARERREAHLERIAALRPDSAHEWLQIWPFSMRRYGAHMHANRRLLRIHEPFQSNDVVRVAAAAPQAWKRDRRLFRAAFRPLLRPSWHVPHARNRFPYFGPATNAALRGPLGLGRQLRDAATRQRGANQESWPVWAEVVASAGMDAALMRHPPEDSALTAALEPDVRHRAAAVARESWPPLSQLALVQLAYMLPGASA